MADEESGSVGAGPAGDSGGPEGPTSTVDEGEAPSFSYPDITEALLKSMGPKILLASDELLNSDDDVMFARFPHPGHESLVTFCLNLKLKKVYEIRAFEESYRSYFVSNVFLSDGTLYLLTPFDPIFLVLPVLRRDCRERAIPVDHLVSAIDSEDSELLKDIITDLSKVADLKGPEDLQAFKYNEDKTLTWLEKKVKRVSSVLKETKIHVTSGAISATYTQNTNGISENEDAYLKYAFGIVSEYLSDDLSKLLSDRFGFKAEEIPTLSGKRKSLSEFNAEPDKKPKLEKSPIKSPDNMFVKKAENKKPDLTSKEKQRLKAAGGSKSITSFFTKK